MRNILVVFILAIATYSSALAQELDNGQIPFYAQPYYNYKPLEINCGIYRKELKVTNPVKLLALADKIRADIDHVPVETIFMLSIRLYDIGKKDEAFYWFQTAKVRAILLVSLFDPKKKGSIGSPAFELQQFFNSIIQLVGIYLNGYGFNDVDKGIATFERVTNEIKDINIFFREMYKGIAFSKDKNMETEKADIEKKYREQVEYFKTHREEIKETRIKNGIQDKY